MFRLSQFEAKTLKFKAWLIFKENFISMIKICKEEWELKQNIFAFKSLKNKWIEIPLKV